VLTTGEKLGFMPKPESVPAELLQTPKPQKPCLYTRASSESESIFAYAWLHQVHIYNIKQVQAESSLKVQIFKLKQLDFNDILIGFSLLESNYQLIT
jgi:hypothetical protein